MTAKFLEKCLAYLEWLNPDYKQKINKPNTVCIFIAVLGYYYVFNYIYNYLSFDQD